MPRAPRPPSVDKPRGAGSRPWGSVRELPSGRWQARTPDTTSLGTHPTEQAAWDALRTEKSARADARTRVPGSRQTVEQLVIEYLAESSPDNEDGLSVNSHYQYRLYFERFVEGTRFGRIRITALTQQDVIQWRAGITVGDTDRTRKQCESLVRGALNWAMENGRIDSNPAVGLPTANTRRRKSNSRNRNNIDDVFLPTWEEFAALVAAPERHRDRLILATLGWVGLRWGELEALEPRDLYLEHPGSRKALRVERTWAYDYRPEVIDPDTGKGVWVEEPPKGGAAATTYVPTPLWDALHAHASRAVVIGNRARVFAPASSRGGIGLLLRSNWDSVFENARAVAGLGPDSTQPNGTPRARGILVKDLRAYAASILVDSGATIQEAKDQLRHEDADTTAKHYARALSDQAHDPARARLRIRRDLNRQGRLDALWNAWARAYPHAAEAVTGVGRRGR